MTDNEKNIQKVADFIYQKPELVVLALQESGYNIDIETATLKQINQLTFTAIYNNEEPFVSKINNILSSEYVGFVTTAIMAGTSIVTSIIGAEAAKKEAAKQRELQKSFFQADLSSKEKLSYEQMKLEGETARTKILINSVADYAISLQEQSTKRLKDTWIYVVALGLSISFIYGTYLTLKEN
jgi:hypothetical protein